LIGEGVDILDTSASWPALGSVNRKANGRSNMLLSVFEIEAYKEQIYPNPKSQTFQRIEPFPVTSPVAVPVNSTVAFPLTLAEPPPLT
jgi:hypothetical protein